MMLQGRAPEKRGAGILSERGRRGQGEGDTISPMSATAPHLSIDSARLADFCRRHHINKLALFGSVLRDDFGPDSDVDVLVEFDPAHVPGLAFLSMETELSEILGRKVDLNTPGFLSPYFRDQVLAEAEIQYAQA